MKIKMYQVQVAAGAVCAFLLAFLRHGAPSKNDTAFLATLEAVSFGLCCFGAITGARALRTHYETLGSDKTTASSDPAYMQERRATQIAAILATAAVGSLVASRYGQNPVYVGLSLLVGMAVIVPVTNQMMGWVKRS